MKRIKNLMLLLAISIISIVLVACGSSNNDANDNSKDNEEEVTITVMDWSDSVKDIRDEFHEKFEEKYPHIKVEYTQTTSDQFKNTILTSMQSGEAPDLFPVPLGMKLDTVVEEGWYQSLEPYIDEDFKNQFVDGAFQNGITMVDDEIYVLPEAREMPDGIIFYNKTLFKEAGLDPENPPKTYSEFREAAKKITESGAGDYYGMIEGGQQSDRWQQLVRNWASLAGTSLNKTTPLNTKTGKADYDTEPVLGVYELLGNLREDDSFHPQTMSISAPEARELFGQGQAGFIVQGAWSIGVWKQDNPDLDFGVMLPPVPDSTGVEGGLPVENVQPWLGIYKESEHPEEAALYLKELFTGDYFQAARAKKGDSFSVIEGIDEEHIEIEQLLDYKEIVDDYGVRVPDPIVRNPETSEVFSVYKDVSPSFGDITGALISGAESDYESMLSDYAEKVQQAFENAVEEAKEKGADVSIEDFEFSNWTINEDYTEEDYAELE